MRYKFSGHQTFVFRYGWLEKGVRGVAECPTIFSEEDALVRLGVGKNMVESIRHWCQVTQLVALDTGEKESSGRHLRVTEIARRLLLDGGWDPFLEDDASLWLIHWLLVSNSDDVVKAENSSRLAEGCWRQITRLAYLGCSSPVLIAGHVWMNAFDEKWAGDQN